MRALRNYKAGDKFVGEVADKLAILGRMVSQGKCHRMRELTIKNIGDLGSMQRKENICFEGERAQHVLGTARGQLLRI